ncbi:hypothetical protein EV197_2150 [Aquimarina brevivitae]|uniref:Uncharacterized protein n=1 Tax=Aquimarina brevivitae TaxID=323412 RepID=A0A4Q7P2G2_9FLAO|nr:hypothetical protein EV197_2150 [Aquimarina brevivitae]
MKTSFITFLLFLLSFPLIAQQVSIFDETVVVKDNLEPMIPRPEQCFT